MDNNSVTFKLPKKDINTYLTNNKSNILQTLETLINISSRTDDKKGVDKVGQTIEEFLTQSKINYKVHKHKTAGNLIVVTTPTTIMKNNVVLSAHMDIVVPKRMHFNYFEKGDKIIGTGAHDLKGGLVVVLYTLKFLAENNLLNNITVTFNPDEETGSVAFEDTLNKYYQGQDYGLVYEAAELKHKNDAKYKNYFGVVTKRKGVLFTTIKTYGVNGHAGVQLKKEDRISAISELVNKLFRIDHLNDFRKGVTVNIGIIEGGISANTIADQASAEIDVRAWHTKDIHTMKQAIEKIANKTFVKGTKTKLEPFKIRPAMESSTKSEKLVEIASKVGAEFNIQVDGNKRGGGSDACNMNKQGVAAIDGFGPPGWGSHDPHSFIFKEGLFDSVRLSIGTVLELLEN